MSRRLLLLLVPIAVLVAGAVVAATRVTSPSEAAADARPPAETAITAVVRRGVLQSQVVFRADVTASDPTVVSGPAPAAGQAVVTGLAVAVGQRVSDGQVLASVSTRPVIIAMGRIPAFRSMVPGMSGVDVTQLQQLLIADGFLGGQPSGVFDAATSAAVGDLYARLGYPAIETSSTAVADLSAARSTVEVDTAALAAATPPAVATARAKLAADQAALTQLQASTGATVPLGEIAFVPSLPTRILTITTPLGGTVGAGGVLSVGSGRVAAAGSVDPSQRAGLHAGEPVTVAGFAASGSPLNGGGTITSVATSATTAGGGAPGVAVGVQILGPDAAQLIGQNVAVTLTSVSSNGPVDIVPLSAISSAANGTTVVLIQHPDGTTAAVPVRVLLTTDDGAGVEPTTGGSLTAGQKVVLGQAPTG